MIPNLSPFDFILPPYFFSIFQRVTIIILEKEDCFRDKKDFKLVVPQKEVFIYGKQGLFLMDNFLCGSRFQVVYLATELFIFISSFGLFVIDLAILLASII